MVNKTGCFYDGRETSEKPKRRKQKNNSQNSKLLQIAELLQFEIGAVSPAESGVKEVGMKLGPLTTGRFTSILA